MAAATSGGGSSKRRSSTPSPVNSPGDFLRFISEHQPGDTVTGTVVEFSSHGAYIDVNGTKGVSAAQGIGRPLRPPVPRDYMSMGAELTLEVEGYDTPLRSVDLRLPAGSTMAPLDSKGTSKSPPAAESPSAQEPPAKKAPAKKAGPAKKVVHPPRRHRPRKQHLPRKPHLPRKRCGKEGTHQEGTHQEGGTGQESLPVKEGCG
jgi:hypothetical protein